MLYHASNACNTVYLSRRLPIYHAALNCIASVRQAETSRRAHGKIVSSSNMPTSVDMQAAARTFFGSSVFAVAGASSNKSKFGHKIFAWYLNHDLPAVPLNPTCSAVTVQRKEYETVPDPSKLANATETSLSVITPPAVTMSLLQSAKEAGIRAVWLQ